MITSHQHYNLKHDELYRVYTKGSFDCVHLGHFALFANIKTTASYYLGCRINQISLTAILSTQDGAKHKEVEYKQSEEERKKSVLSTGIVDRVEFCEETIDFVQLNIDRIDLFAVGFDQAQTAYFKKIMAILGNKNKKCIQMEHRLPGLSSTRMREQVDKRATTIKAARFNIERDYKLDEKSKHSIARLYLESIVTNNHLNNFHLSLKSFFDELRIYLGGCQAVGKTTIAKRFRDKYRSFQRFTSSEAFMQYLGISREELEHVDETNLQTIDKVLLFITKSYPKLFLDGHFLFGEKSRKYSFNVAIFASASIDEIFRRKMIDKSRERRDNLTPQTIFGEYYLKIVRACRFSDKVFILDNTYEIDEAIRKIERIIMCSQLSKSILKDHRFVFADDILANLLASPIKRQEVRLNNDYLRVEGSRMVSVRPFLPKRVEYIAINIPQNLLVHTLSLVDQLIPNINYRFKCKPDPYHVTLVHCADQIEINMCGLLKELITRITTQKGYINITITGFAYNKNALCLLVELPNGFLVTSGYPHVTIGLREDISGKECVEMLHNKSCIKKIFDTPITIQDMPIVI